MTDMDLFELGQMLLRSTRNNDVISFVCEVHHRLATKTLMRPISNKGKRPSRAAYMRAYRIKQRANPFA
jgi:hypothetical protein